MRPGGGVWVRFCRDWQPSVFQQRPLRKQALASHFFSV